MTVKEWIEKASIEEIHEALRDDRSDTKDLRKRLLKELELKLRRKSDKGLRIKDSEKIVIDVPPERTGNNILKVHQRDTKIIKKKIWTGNKWTTTKQEVWVYDTSDDKHIIGTSRVTNRPKPQTDKQKKNEDFMKEYRKNKRR